MIGILHLSDIHFVKDSRKNPILTKINELVDAIKNDLTACDNLNRVKYECNGKLVEFENDKGYFYLEFYEGQKIEFWSESINLEHY